MSKQLRSDMNSALISGIKLTSITVVIVCDVIANAMVIAVIVKYPQLREDRTNLFMLSLMVADLLVGITHMPISAMLCSNSKQAVLDMIPYLPKFQLICMRLFVFAAVKSMCWVTVCKMVAITKPFTYERHLSRTRCFMIIAMIWFTGFLVCLAGLPLEATFNTKICLTRIDDASPADALAMHSFVIGIAVPIVIITCATARIFAVILRTHRQIVSQAQSIGGDQGSVVQATSPTLQSIRSGRNVLIICAAIIAGMMPTMIYDVITSERGTGEWNLLSFFIMWTAPCNTFIISFLFVFLHRSVRSKTAEMLTGVCNIAGLPMACCKG